MYDIDKTEINRLNSERRERRRDRFFSLYALAVVILAAIALAIASLTFLFKVNEIIISGESDNYTYMEVIEASGILAGDNLIRMDTSEKEQNITKKLLYVEEAEIHKKFPATITVNVTKCIPAFNVEYLDSIGNGAGVLLVSRKGKILSINDYFVEGLPTIYGMNVMRDEIEAGQVLKPEDERINTAFSQFSERCTSWDPEAIDGIDMTDTDDITIYYRSGVVFHMGGSTDILYKLDLAETIMNEDAVRGKKGTLTMIGTNQCSFRSSLGASAVISDPETEAVTTSEAVTTTTYSGESVYRPPSYTESSGDGAGNGGDTAQAPVQDNNQSGWDNTQDMWTDNSQQNSWGDTQDTWTDDTQTGGTDGDLRYNRDYFGSDGVGLVPGVGGIEPDDGYWDENGYFHYWWVP